MLWTDGVDVKLYLPCVTLEVFLVWLSLHVCCCLDWRKTTYFCARTVMLGEFAASLEWQLFYSGLTTWHLELNMGWNILFLLVIHGGVFSISIFWNGATAPVTPASHYRKGTGRGWDHHLAVYAISNMSYALSASPFSANSRRNFHHPHPGGPGRRGDAFRLSHAAANEQHPAGKRPFYSGCCNYNTTLTKCLPKAWSW